MLELDIFSGPFVETLITPAFNWPITYNYNGNGHLLSQSWHGLTIDYAPNALGQATKAGTYATEASYYPNGAIKQFTYGNGIVHTMTQNTRQLPSRSTDCTLAGTCAVANRVLDLGYTFDANANVGAITDYTAAAKQTRGMTYDGLDRLIQTTSIPFGTASYTYDALDNLTRVTVGASAQVAARDQFYCYNATTQRLDFVRNTSCSGGAVIALDYDEQGNLKNKNSRLHSFDFGNRLRTITGGIPSISTSYNYDGLGRRVKDIVGGVSKYSQYSLEGKLMAVSDIRTGIFSEYFYFAGSLVAIRERDGANVYTTKYQHTDALGSPIAVTNVSKTVILTSEFEPYGKVVNRAEVDGPSYTGHVQDASSGLTYMQQRYYDPMIGRFLSVDPVTANSATGANFNRYWYANNNPYKFVDPDGREAEWNGFDPNNKDDRGLYLSAQKYNSPQGVFTISSHGWALSPDGNLLQDGSGTAMIYSHLPGTSGYDSYTAQEVWDFIKNDYQSGAYSSILVAACGAGTTDARGESFGSQLSKISGEEALSTEYLVGYPASGRIHLGTPVEIDGKVKAAPTKANYRRAKGGLPYRPLSPTKYRRPPIPPKPKK